MASLWEKLNHLYPHKFSSACGIGATNATGELTDVAQTWAGGLSGVSGEHLAIGLRACVASGKEWPPTLPEFRALCLGQRNGKNEYGLDYVPQCYRAPPIVDRSRLLSSDDRDARRRAAVEKVAALRAALKPREEKKDANVPEL